MKVAPETERQIERLMVLADVPQLTRPFRVSQVFEAHDKYCADRRSTAICQDVSDYLSRFHYGFGVTQLSGAVYASDDDEPKSIPNQRGRTTESNYQVSGEVYWAPSDYVSFNVGAVAYKDEVLPTAYFSFGNDIAQVDIGWREYWYSPFQDSSMLYSTNAQASPSVAISNSRPLTSVNFKYEFFLAKLEETEGILYQGERSPGRPYLAGMHLEFEPLPGWSLGLNRTFQFGGDGRETSFSDFLKAFFDPSGGDNQGGSDEELGNQIASVTSRFNFSGKVPFSVYMEYAGEDTADGSDWRLGNVAMSLGLYFPQVTENLDFTWEITDWQNAWYVNGIYANGYTNEGSIIGHWAGEQRVFKDAVGAQTNTLIMNWDIAPRNLIHATYRTVENEESTQFDYVRSHELQLRYSYDFGDVVSGIDLYAGRTTQDEKFSQAGVFLRW